MGKSLDLCSSPLLKKCSRRKRLPEDRLSSFPDDILLFILSFLTYKDVVQTFLVSSRWLSLRMHFSALHFYEPVPKSVLWTDPEISDRERRHFVTGVNRVLRKHKTPYLKEFKIICDLDKRNQKDIDKWLVSAFAKKVERLEFNLSGPGKNPPRSTSKLGRFLIYGGKNELSQFAGKCLKSLSLRRVDITSEAIYFLLRNCPFLERLEVCFSTKLKELVISDPTLVLKHLKIKESFRLNVVSISNINLVSLDKEFRELTLTNLPMLVELFIKGYNLRYVLSRKNSCFFQLETLKLKEKELQSTIECLALNSCYKKLTKLRRLVIEFESSERESLLRLIRIINSCPCLEEFVLMLDWIRLANWSKWDMGAVERYRCKPLNKKSLKVFEFVGYRGRVKADQLIRHVLANAVGLVKMTIDPTNAFHIDRNARYARRDSGDIEAEKEARIKALQLYDALKGDIPPHVEILIH